MWFKSECDKISERLWDYSAQRLSTAETAQIESHLLQCTRCQAEAEAYRQTVGMLGVARQLPVPASQTSWRDLRPSLAPARRPMLRSADFLPRLTLTGAGAALGATLLVVFFSGGHHVTPTGNTTPLASGTPSTASSAGTQVVQDNSEQGARDSGFSGQASLFSASPDILTAPNAEQKANPAPTPKAPTLRRRNHPDFTRVAIGGKHATSVVASEDSEAQLDGRNVSPRASQNYVLNPVSSSPDDETARHYVISSIPASQNGNSAVASNDGTEEGRAW